MALIQLKNIHLSFAEAPLFNDLSLQVSRKQRIALIGRNGTGKSTLLKIIQKIVQPDMGLVEGQAHTITALQQNVPDNLSGNVYDFLVTSLGDEAAWQSTHTVDRIIQELQLNPQAQLSDLSGGEIRRCLLAQALIQEPDVLLLDEPTNHMDMPTIQWLENYLIQSQLTCILITHDRSFLQQVATHIAELDRGELTTWAGDYQSFLLHKSQQLEAEERANALFDKRLAQEERWIRQGIKARRTRNEGRVRALKQMRYERAQRREQRGQVNLNTQQQAHSGKQVCVANNISVQLDGKTIIKDFSCIIQRKDKVGIIGHSGCGKTTLIRCLLGQLQPDQGTVTLGTQLDIAYFDQHRHSLDIDATPMDVVAEGRSHITINGQSKHIMSYLQDFLFSPLQARSQIRTLSGGERNRLLLAKLFSQPANCLVLDEPTNDLDIETLELLEQYLVEFDGTVIVVSHDRTFIENVVTQTYRFDEHGHITEHMDHFIDTPKTASSTSEKTTTKSNTKKSTLTHEERKELNKLPAKIEKLEAKIAQAQATLNQPDFYQQSQDVTQPQIDRFESLQQEHDQLYQRWEVLLEKET